MTKDLPTYEMPGFDGIGANEYIVDVTHPETLLGYRARTVRLDTRGAG
jgi:hypothetical protein